MGCLRYCKLALVVLKQLLRPNVFSHVFQESLTHKNTVHLTTIQKHLMVVESAYSCNGGKWEEHVRKVSPSEEFPRAFAQHLSYIPRRADRRESYASAVLRRRGSDSQSQTPYSFVVNRRTRSDSYSSYLHENRAEDGPPVGDLLPDEAGRANEHEVPGPSRVHEASSIGIRNAAMAVQSPSATVSVPSSSKASLIIASIRTLLNHEQDRPKDSENAVDLPNENPYQEEGTDKKNSGVDLADIAIARRSLATEDNNEVQGGSPEADGLDAASKDIFDVTNLSPTSQYTHPDRSEGSDRWEQLHDAAYTKTDESPPRKTVPINLGVLVPQKTLVEQVHEQAGSESEGSHTEKNDILDIRSDFEQDPTTAPTFLDIDVKSSADTGTETQDRIAETLLSDTKSPSDKPSPNKPLTYSGADDKLNADIETESAANTIAETSLSVIQSPSNSACAKEKETNKLQTFSSIDDRSGAGSGTTTLETTTTVNPPSDIQSPSDITRDKEETWIVVMGVKAKGKAKGSSKGLRDGKAPETPAKTVPVSTSNESKDKDTKESASQPEQSGNSGMTKTQQKREKLKEKKRGEAAAAREVDGAPAKTMPVPTSNKSKDKNTEESATQPEQSSKSAMTKTQRKREMLKARKRAEAVAAREADEAMREATREAMREAKIEELRARCAKLNEAPLFIHLRLDEEYELMKKLGEAQYLEKPQAALEDAFKVLAGFEDRLARGTCTDESLDRYTIHKLDDDDLRAQWESEDRWRFVEWLGHFKGGNVYLVHIEAGEDGKLKNDGRGNTVAQTQESVNSEATSQEDMASSSETQAQNTQALDPSGAQTLDDLMRKLGMDDPDLFERIVARGMQIMQEEARDNGDDEESAAASGE